MKCLSRLLIVSSVCLLYSPAAMSQIDSETSDLGGPVPEVPSGPVELTPGADAEPGDLVPLNSPETTLGRPEPLGQQDLGQQLPESQNVVGRAPSQAVLEKPISNAPRCSDAFRFLPGNQTVRGGTVSTDCKDKTETFVAVFDGACHFQCHPHAGGMLRSGGNLVVYEGMRVSVDQYGAYEVSLIAEVPDVPAVMLLQLAVQQDLHGQQLIQGKITLPPIVFEREGTYSRHQASRSVKITRQGYSPVLRRILNQQSYDGIQFTRHGSVRFGSVPERGDYSFVLNDES